MVAHFQFVVANVLGLTTPIKRQTCYNPDRWVWNAMWTWMVMVMVDGCRCRCRWHC